MDTLRYGLVGLPEPVFENILQYLNIIDIKNLSWSSCELLFRVEDIQNVVPRLYVISAVSTSQSQKALRMLPETYPDSYRSTPDPSKREVEFISLYCSPCLLPSYNEVQLAEARRALRFCNSYGQRIWICPHRACTYDDLARLAEYRPSPLPSTYSTVPILCPFPKCSLWARHAFIATATAPRVYELCSTVRIYRYLCSDYPSVQETLRDFQFQSRVLEATSKLNFGVCRHLKLSDMVHRHHLKEICLLDGSERYVEIEQVPLLQRAIDHYHCRKCAERRSYTTWGIFARYTRNLGRYWLDIEMMICRPVFGDDFRQSDDGLLPPHRLLHWDVPGIMENYQEYWEEWAMVVARDGFDWRVPLAPGILRYPSRGLLDFPY